MLSGLTDWVTDVIDKLGYIGVAVLVAIENLFPPIPSEIVLPFAGFVARDGGATLPGMILAATLGSLAGAWVLYGIAAAIGPERLHAFVHRYGKWFRLTHDDVARAEAWFDRRATMSVLVGRCVPLIRSLVSIPAGFRRMPFVTFTIYTFLGSLVWNGALIGAGYVLRDNWEDVEKYIDYFQYVVIAVLVGAVAWFVWRRFLSADARRSAARLADSEER
ncbi:MAG TPA: DedA family protein [Acidimicrobiia bacterium]